MVRSIRIAGLPEDAKPLMAQLLEEELLPVSVLMRAVESYRQLIREAASQNGKANAHVGDQIADALLALMSRVNAKTGDENLHIIQAAVRYFVIQDDGSGHDLLSRVGLYDDARVVNAVLRYFGRDDLVVHDLLTASSGRLGARYPPG